MSTLKNFPLSRSKGVMSAAAARRSAPVTRQPTHVPASEPHVPVGPATDPIATAMDAAIIAMPRLLLPKDVAEQLGVTERTLERWRITGEGPRFVKISRSTVRYKAEDIAAFINERLRANTSC